MQYLGPWKQKRGKEGSIAAMGLIKVTTKITSLEGAKGSYEEVFLVDTGATDSVAPADELEKIGVRRVGKMTYELADGTVREYSFGLVQIEFMGEITAGRVVFGERGSEPLLGVTALESVGIMVDPVNKTLKRLPAIPLK
jgi:clan AA aspartic protease